MSKAQGDRTSERRRYLRLETPIGVWYTVPNGGAVKSADARDISADGIRIRVRDASLKEGDVLELKLGVPNAANAVHSSGRVVWKKSVSLEDGAPSDVGIEFAAIEEDNKNTFLKFLCDEIYNLPKI